MNKIMLQFFILLLVGDFMSVFDSKVFGVGYILTVFPFVILYIIVIPCVLALFYLYMKRKFKEDIKNIEKQKEEELFEKEKIYKADIKKKKRKIILLKEQKRQYELQNKSQELVKAAMNFIYKNEKLLEINIALKKIIEELKDTENQNITLPDIISNLENVQLEIQQDIESDEDWIKFSENFDVIYKNFLKRLSTQFPTLTKSDLNLCAYLKMGLSSKDIAPLLNMSFRSVEMARYRLRKKFDLDREVNLSDFLQNY